MPHNKRKNKHKNRTHKSQQQHTPAHEQRAADPVEQPAQREAEKQQQQQHVEQTSVQPEPEHEEKAFDVQESETTPIQQDETQSQIDADNQLDQLEAQEPETSVEVPAADDTPMDSGSQEPAPPAALLATNDSPMADEPHEQEETPSRVSEPASDEQAPMQESEDAPTTEQPHDEHHEQRQQELAKLRAIEHKVQQIHDKLATRLPLQRCHLAARVCGAIWAARTRLAKLARESDSDMESVSATTTSSTTTSSDASAQEQQQQQQQLYSQLAKKLRMELGAFDYQTKEQGELLTRLLCELDDILSFGDAEVKRARKALVVAIQSDALPLADAMRDQSARLKAFGEALLATLPLSESTSSPATPTASSRASDASTATQQTGASAPQFDDVGSDEEGADNQAMDAARDANNNDEDNGEVLEDAIAHDEFARQQAFASSATPASPPRQRLNHHHAQYQQQPQQQPHSSHAHAYPTHQQQPPHKSAVDVQALPVWRPYYQLQKRRDGLYLVANLRGVEPANVHVKWLESVGVLRISGHKLPTQKDLAVTRFSGVPTFGRFEIAERLPVDALAMDSATQALRADGTLEIRMPYYVRPRPQPQPNLFSRGSLFDAPRPFFW